MTTVNANGTATITAPSVSHVQAKSADWKTQIDGWLKTLESVENATAPLTGPIGEEVIAATHAADYLFNSLAATFQKLLG